MCGGEMVDAPCSRIGHIYRKFAPFSAGKHHNYHAKVRLTHVCPQILLYYE